jgi:proteasome lid subunit RPN8/RPN11
MSKHRDSPDVRQLPEAGLARAAFPAAHCDFRVYFDDETHRRIVQHAKEDTSVEICGVLVGRWEQDDNGPFVVITAAIRCDDAAKKSGEVTFTHESWNKINHEMDTRFVDLKIVGWYHSHPSFGVFLSERDTFIHEHFFSNPGQVALVVDPVQEIEGVFAWRNGKPKPCSHYWVGDRICVPVEERPAGASETRQRVGPSAAAESRPAEPEPLSLMRVFFHALPLVAVFLIGYLLADTKTAWEQQRIVEGTVAHFGTWKCLRPNLRENLAVVDGEVSRVQGAVDDLSGQHAKLAGKEGEDVRAKWSEVSAELYHIRDNLRLLGAVYGLDAAETAAYKSLLADKLTELGSPAKQKPKGEKKEKSVGEEKGPPKPPEDKAAQPTKPGK